MTTEEFRLSLLEYLVNEQELIEADIEAHKSLTDDEKVADGFMIRDAKVVSAWGEDCYDLSVSVNSTRLRTGDIALLTGNGRKTEVRIIENGFESLSIHCDAMLQVGLSYNIEVSEAYLLKPLQTVLEQCIDGSPGYSFLSQLARATEVTPVGMFPFADFTARQYVDGLNADQEDCCMKIAKNPSLLCMQGPPGTGKTKTLAASVNMVSSQGQQVLVVALTHQAVNNALNQIHKLNPFLPIIKVGDAGKSAKLDDGIGLFSSMQAYSNSLAVTKRDGTKKYSKSPRGLVIGMTFHSALINFGLRHPRSVFPTYMFVDEASQMPLTYAAALGTFGAGSICMFGDSQQMPPIFRPELMTSPFSVSALDHASSLENVPKAVLHTTYRMNDEITEYVSEKFYEPYGIELVSAGTNRDRRLVLDLRESGDDRIINIFTEDMPSIVKLNASGRDNIYSCEENYEEALFSAQVASCAMTYGNLEAKDIAVITPYRRQVNAIRSAFKYLNMEDYPLVDTVERLQGQDVELIILSFAATDEEYIKSQIDFLFNPNRLNVMISRAKTKVVMLMSDFVKEQYKRILG